MRPVSIRRGTISQTTFGEVAERYIVHKKRRKSGWEKGIMLVLVSAN